MDEATPVILKQTPQVALLEKHIQSYQWGELWQMVKSLSPRMTDASEPLLAIKAMLLAGWWQESELARACIAIYPQRLTEPLTHFCLSYAALCLGDSQRYASLHRHAPRRQAPWMRDWLDLEQLGRAGKTTLQLRKMRALTRRCKSPPEWACVALLQSSESQRADIRLIRSWLEEIDKGARGGGLLRALAARCDMSEAWQLNGNPEPIESMPSPVLYRYARFLLNAQRLPEALQAYDLLTRAVFANFPTLQTWLALACSIPQGWAAISERTQFAVNLVPRSLMVQGTVAVFALIVAWLKGDIFQLQAIIDRFCEYLKLPKTASIGNTQVFFIYVGKLHYFRRQNPTFYLAAPAANAEALVALGESHSLSISGIYGRWLSKTCKGLSAFVMGVKMHHMADPTSSYHGECVRLHLEALKAKPVHLLLTIGEIDCRPDEGLWPAHRKTGQPLDALIERTVTGYIDFLQHTLVDHQLLDITVQGIPAPGYAFEDDKDPGDIPGFVAMIRAVNDCLRAKTLAAGFNFLDVHAATVGEDGQGNGRWHLDGYHLSPAFYRQAQDWLRLPN